MHPELQIRGLLRADVGPTAKLLAAAMDDDPAYVFLFPRRAERARGLEDFFTRNLRTHLPFACTHVAVEADAVVGTVTLRPPEGFSISVLTMIRRGLLPFGLAHGVAAVRRLLALKAAYDDLESRTSGGEPHWHVHMMAVNPSRQGGGIGSRLLAKVLSETVDARGGGAPPAVLTTHTPRNVAFYTRFGFETTDARDVALRGGLPYRVWAMRRARAASR